MSTRTRVLLVDDDPDFVEATTIVLEASGFEVISASSGVDGLRMVEEEDPDIVILDVMMENTDEGFAVARRIRRGLGSSVPIVMLTSVGRVTGYDFDPGGKPSFFPVDLFLEKPVPPNVLIQKIREIIGREEAGDGSL